MEVLYHIRPYKVPEMAIDWMIIKETELVGGLEHDFYVSIYWKCHHPN